MKTFKELREGRFDIEIPAPKGPAGRKNPTRTALNKKITAKYADKIIKAAERDRARSARAGGALTRKNSDTNKYRSGHSAKFFSHFESVEEGKNDYPIYHKTYSDAMQASYAFAKKKGFEVDKNDIDDKVATGPRKPSNGKTNSFTLKLVGQKNKRLAVQVTNLDNRRYELNCYIT